MKYISNLHTHTTYCDGKNSIEENILSAIEKNFISLGFSGHSYFYHDKSSMSLENMNKYLEDVKKYKSMYKEKIEIYVGIEADYYSNLNKITDKEMSLDYRIGSVHFIRDNKNNYFPLDSNKEGFERAINHFGGIKEVIYRYYKNIIDMIESQSPDIIGHLDLIKKFNFDNCYFDSSEKWYCDIIDKVLDIIKKNNCIVEINTGRVKEENLYGYYPNDMIIEKILSMNIPITINTDAHHCDRLDNYYFEIAKKLKEMGFKTVKILMDNSFRDVEISF